MKVNLLIVTLAILTIAQLFAQSEFEHAFFDQLRSDAIILSEEGIIQGKDQLEDYLKDLVGVPQNKYTYTSEFSIKVHDGLDYDIGTLSMHKKSMAVMFLKTKDNTSTPNIEFLVIHKKLESDNNRNELDTARKEWMHLCNAHQADQLVSKLYAADAYYYNRGRLLQGTEAITTEYGYMNDPNYSLKLTPKYIVTVNPDIAYEIGRCSGSYPNPYMLVWKKMSNGQWVILMDTNY